MISFFVMRRMPGRPQPVRISLGRYPDIGLAKARALATVAIGDLVSGIHPKAREPQVMTFAALAEAFLSRPAAARQRTADEIRKTVGRYLLPRWGRRDAASITRADAITMVEALDRASGPDTAAKALALASSIFRHAMTREQIAINPCALIKIDGLRRRHGAPPACSDHRRDRASVAGNRGHLPGRSICAPPAPDGGPP